MPAGRARRGSGGAGRRLAGDQREPAHCGAGARAGSWPGPGDAGAGVGYPGGGARVRAALARGALRPGPAAAGLPGGLPSPSVGDRPARLVHQRRRVGPG